MDPQIAPPGLSEAEAANRLAVDGYNELPADKPRSVVAIAAGVAREPMLLLLVAAGAIYLLLGDTGQAVILLLSVFGVMGISFYQERKTERALAALRDLSSPRALVIRDGKQRRVAGREVVRGDIVLLSEGDRVPADGALVSGENVSIDESLLTGESLPVTKAPPKAAPKEMARPGGADTPFVFSGTLAVQGQGSARILATGAATEIGRIGRALATLERSQTRLQQETRRIVKLLAVLGLSLCVLLAIIYALARGDWLNGFLAGLTLAMAILPEEFPVVLTVFLALGAWRMARRNVLTRRVAAIEMLGAATVLCADKTGTLTQNRMSVAALYANGALTTEFATLSEAQKEVLHYAALASRADPFDPMERAIHEAADKFLLEPRGKLKLARVYPLTRELLAVTQAWENGDYVIAAKGAPEAIAELCRLDAATRRSLVEEVNQMAENGLRVLGVAKASHAGALPESVRDFEFCTLGLIGLADPIRESAPEAVRECRQAGIRVVMITGDYSATARSIARRIGLDPTGIMTGQELEMMDDQALSGRIGGVSVFCRVVPEHKLRIVNALKANGEVVAMTGDGVNDAPALKAAHVGIAMGERGTDVAREAADVVLLDDDFSSIVQAVRLGRRIFDNLRKAFAFVVAVHVPTVGMSFLPLLFGWPLMLFPIHIVVLELIIDPACTIAFEAEPEETGVMRRAPRRASETLLNAPTLVASLLQGIVVLLLVFAVYAFMLAQNDPESEARAAAFTTLIIGNLGLILTNRSRAPLVRDFEPNPALWWVLVGALIMLVIAVYLPPVSELFEFSQPGALKMVAASAAGAAAILIIETLKLVQLPSLRTN